MNIIFDNIVFSLQKAGGISVVWKELISRFIRDGRDKLLFIEREGANDNLFRQDIEIPYHQVQRVGRTGLIIDRYLNPKIMLREPFIFHSSYFRICGERNAINVTTVHDFTYDYFFKGHKLFYFLHIWQRNRAIRKSDSVVCISENTRMDLLKLLPDVDIKKISVIYNGVSKEYRVTEDKDPSLYRSLLWVGRRDSYKNWEWFVKVAARTGRPVVFCGAPLSHTETEYVDKVLGSGRYRVCSFLNNEELNKVYNSVFCLVYPSSYEGFGIPVIEAQKAGCPVIALEASSIPEIIGETPLLMQQLSDDAFMEKLRMLEDEKVRMKIIEKGLINADRFSWEKTCEQYRALYEKLLSHS